MRLEQCYGPVRVGYVRIRHNHNLSAFSFPLPPLLRLPSYQPWQRYSNHIHGVVSITIVLRGDRTAALTFNHHSSPHAPMAMLQTSVLSQLSPTSLQGVPPYQRKLLDESSWRPSPRARLQAGPLTELTSMPPLVRRRREINHKKKGTPRGNDAQGVCEGTTTPTPPITAPNPPRTRVTPARVGRENAKPPSPFGRLILAECGSPATPQTARTACQLALLRDQLQTNAECLVALESRLLRLGLQGDNAAAAAATPESHINTTTAGEGSSSDGHAMSSAETEAAGLRREVRARSRAMDALEAKIVGLRRAATDVPSPSVLRQGRGCATRDAPLSPLTPVPHRLRLRAGTSVPVPGPITPLVVQNATPELDARVEASQHKTLDLADRMLLRLRARVDSIKPSKRAPQAGTAPASVGLASVSSPRLEAARAEADRLRTKLMKLEVLNRQVRSPLSCGRMSCSQRSILACVTPVLPM